MICPAGDSSQALSGAVPEAGVQVMQIINLTHDSFYAASRHCDPEEVARQVREALAQGAHFIDLGACSTRPGAEPVSEEVEWGHLAPVLARLRTEFPDLALSIDTFRPGVVARAYEVWGGFFWVNDVSGGQDPDLLPLIGRLQLGWIAMHNGGTRISREAARSCQAEDMTAQVRAAFEAFVSLARTHGIRSLMLDPGFGFHKDLDQNFTLVRNLPRLVFPGIPLLVGISRKRMTWQAVGTNPQGALTATSALHLQLCLGGAQVLRVHDTLPALQITRLARHLMG